MYTMKRAGGTYGGVSVKDYAFYIKNGSKSEDCHVTWHEQQYKHFIAL